MAERGIHIVRAHLAKLPPSDSLTIAERRAQYERAEKVFPTPAEVKVERVTAPAAPAEWLRPPSAAPGRVVLYLHGGGYVIGSPRSHRHLAAAIATAAGSSALLLEYRCAPEAPFPAAVDDAVAAYRWLLDQGVSAGGIVIAGDSAGGGLTVADAARPARCPVAAARGRGVHLAVGGSHVQRRQLCDQGRHRPDREAGRGRRDGARVPGHGGPAHPAGLAALRRPPRPAAAAHPGGQRGGAARRLDPARGAGEGGGRRHHARGVGRR